MKHAGYILTHFRQRGSGSSVISAEGTHLLHLWYPQCYYFWIIRTPNIEDKKIVPLLNIFLLFVLLSLSLRIWMYCILLSFGSCQPSSRWYLRTQECSYVLNPFSTKFLQCCILNSSNIETTDDELFPKSCPFILESSVFPLSTHLSPLLMAVSFQWGVSRSTHRDRELVVYEVLTLDCSTFTTAGNREAGRSRSATCNINHAHLNSIHLPNCLPINFIRWWGWMIFLRQSALLWYKSF